MKILVCAGYSPSLINFRGPLLQALRSSGHDVIAAGPEDLPEVRARLSDWGVGFRTVPLARTGLNPVEDLSALLALRRLMKELRPDLLLSYTIKPVIYGGLAARLAGVPHVVSLITGLGYSFIGTNIRQKIVGGVARFLYRFALGFNQLIFFQNEDDEALFRNEKLVPQRVPTVVVRGSGVDLAHYSRVPAVLPANGRGLTFLMIARLIVEKGVHEFAAAARAVRLKHPEARFVLVGGVEARPGALGLDEVEHWVADGLLEWKGEQKDVRPFLQEAQVYVLPSYREGTPRTVLEAMAIGRAVITTDVPGCRQTISSPQPDDAGLLRGANGYLVRERDAGSLAEAMERFLSNPAEVIRMGAESRKFVETEFEVGSVCRKMIAELEELKP